MCISGKMEFPIMLAFLFFSFTVFASIEPISDSAHTLSVINDAMDKLDALKQGNFIDENGTEEEMIAAAKKARCHDFIMNLTATIRL